MLRNEPKPLYIYKCIKKEEKGNYQIGEVFNDSINTLNEEYYKLIGTYRKAFVGNMQEKLNEAYGENLMEVYAKGDNHPAYSIARIKNEYVYVKRNIFIQFYEFMKFLFKGKVEKEDYSINEMFGEYNNLKSTER